MVSSFKAGGSPTDLTGDPTKRVKLRADIWPDQPDVPAVITTYFLMGPFVTRTNRWPLHRLALCRLAFVLSLTFELQGFDLGGVVGFSWCFTWSLWFFT